MAELVERAVLTLAIEAAQTFRVLVLNGPRQAGKSTLLEQMQARLGGKIVSLDEEPYRLEAVTDPAGFVLTDERFLYIDEVQRGGDALVRAVKARVDNRANSTRYILAGSTNFLTVPTLSESLAGRAILLEVWPFAQAELVPGSPNLIDVLFAEPRSLLAAPPENPTSRADYFQRVCAGGFPETFHMPPGRTRDGWFDSYLHTVTQRDITEISDVRLATELPRLVKLLSALTGQELVKAELATRSGIDRSTVRNYLPLLRTVYLYSELPAWSRNPVGRVTKHPKVHLTDTGLAAFLLGVDATALQQLIAPTRGQLVETFAHNEILKLRTWSETQVDLFHWRDRTGPEVDLILETRAGGVCGIEVKAALDITPRDLRNMTVLADKLGDQFQQGVLFYLGAHALSLGPKLMALPLSALWGATSDTMGRRLRRDLDDIVDPTL